MAKKKLPKTEPQDLSSPTPKSATIFDHLAHITHKKKDWNSLSDLDKKSFSPYMINRWLSMQPDLIELVNEFQKYTIGLLKPREVYKIYHGFLPSNKLPFNKYVKGAKEDKYNPDLIKLMCEYFAVSSEQASEYIEMFELTPKGKEELISIIAKYGKTDKEISKLLKT